MKTLHKVSYILLWVGGLNWGLIGFFNYNLVSALFESMPTLEMLTYVLVGAAAVYSATTHLAECKVCSKK